MNISQPVPSAIAAVEFGFYTSDEIKALSVKQIQNPATFDTLLHPVPGGLYDPALGAWGDNSCTTCNLPAFACPGHVGHIELPVPVYHPTFMSIALRLLRSKCAYCDKLKMSRREVNRYHCKLRLIQNGLIAAAEEIENIDVLPKQDEGEGSGESSDESPVDDIMRRRNLFVKKSIKAASKEDVSWDWEREKNEGVSTARQAVIKDFMKSISTGKACRNCQGISPTYRKDRYVKIFEKALSSKDKAKMAQGDYKAVNSVVKVQQGEKSTGDFDEGVADMYSSSNGEDDDEEGDGEDLDVDGDVVMASSAPKNTKGTKVKVEVPQRFVNATEVKASLDALFEQEQDIFSLVYSSRSTSKKPTKITADMFFLQTLLVPPNKYRPEARTGDNELSEDQQNNLYKLILKRAENIVMIYQEISKGNAEESSNRRRRDYQDLQEDWCALQDAVNSLIDRDRNPIQGAAGKKNEDGIKQKLEKKEGLFRKNMMGKRVNFAARSVISPDPNIETNEIGVPPVFAKKLTYPEPVTSHNFKELQQAVINGIDKWPGAAAIENENGMVISLRTKTPDERQALANQLLATSSGSSSGGRNKKVHRHLTNGDVVLMNRQPTLHKPSIMGHRARVLPGEKTIRMHYANCNTYNADFDGDEMNMHFPQNEVARAEALQIADTDHQYLVATSGKPLRGLIQDHISVSVWLCNRDTFFDRASYQQLIYNCLRPESGHIVGDRIETVPPAILKPVPRWTGKQVITTILKNITPPYCGPLYLTSKTSTPADRWGPTSEEGEVLFHGGEFITGILDKSQIGPSGGGFVHSIHEAYGPAAAGKVLSILGRLLTKYLHMRAFTCGMDDLRLTPQGEQARKEKLRAANDLGIAVAAKYVGLNDEIPSDTNTELLSRLEDVLRDDSKQAGLDMLMNSAASDLSSSVTMACLPGGLVKQFPKNQMQNMTVSGAKGSAVNANLISCNLGQQVLEGRRVPVMVSGKSLPCFKPFETNIRAGGYVVNRFLTGIRPQEYYFHAMAGREGLIDTAVKTSRSGYLQRCLIKGMEGLKVEYDTSVRDSDGSMIQFLYGEDGLDVTKQKHLRDFKFILQNLDSELHQLNTDEGGFTTILEEKDVILKKMKKAIKSAKANGIHHNSGPDPVQSLYNPGRHAFATSESYYSDVMSYLKGNPDNLVKDKSKSNSKGLFTQKTLEPMLMAKYLKSLVDPGEAVGIVAGQSVGEPSTQMTLNTFHLAGHSAKNVTLGIPRLREIVMTASGKISTPSMTLQLNEELSTDEGEMFAKSISELFLSEVVDQATVQERIDRGMAYAQAKIYDIDIKLFPSVEYTKTYAITKSDVIKAFQYRFAPRLQSLTRKALKKGKDPKVKKVAEIGIASRALKDIRPDAVRERDEDDDDEEEEDDATNDKQRANRAEAVSYGANDEDDDEIQAIAQKEAMNPEDLEDIDEGIGHSPPANADEDDDDTPQEGDATTSVSIDREAEVKKKCNDFVSFKWDEKDGEWCRLSLEYEADVDKLLMLTIVEKALREVEIQKITDIGACTFVAEEKIKDFSTGESKDISVVHTAGVNLQSMHMYSSFINPNKISTNDIAAMLRVYGVEACRATIIQELSGVFGGHGISVDQRHLNLIADFMTRGGGFVGFSRNGLKGSVSPFMKMSFETTVGFLADAVCDGDFDDLSSPSSRIVIGRMSKVGTGAFDVLTQVPVQ